MQTWRSVTFARGASRWQSRELPAVVEMVNHSFTDIDLLSQYNTETPLVRQEDWHFGNISINGLGISD